MAEPTHGQGTSNDRELWREHHPEGDAYSYYAPSIHVTEGGGIGINVDGTVHVRTLREWHKLAALERHSIPGGAAGYRPAIVEFPDGGYAQMVLEDTAIVHAEQMVVTALRRMGSPQIDGELLGFQWELAASPPPSVWMAIDTAPKDGTNILVATGAIVREAYWMPDYYGDEEGACWMPANTDEEYGHELHPTHWAPLLPPPPQQEGK